LQGRLSGIQAINAVLHLPGQPENALAERAAVEPLRQKALLDHDLDDIAACGAGGARGDDVFAT